MKAPFFLLVSYYSLVKRRPQTKKVQKGTQEPRALTLNPKLKAKTSINPRIRCTGNADPNESCVVRDLGLAFAFCA